MANLGTTFDAQSVDPNTGFDLLPAGKYRVQIVTSEMRPTKDGNGQYLWLELDVLEGEYAGRKLFDRLNLVNANQQTVDIAQRTLSAICHATDRLQVQDSEQLHLVPMLADVTVSPPKNGYGEANRIRYRPLEQARHLPQTRTGAAPAPATSIRAAVPVAVPVAAPTPVASPQPQGFANAPWKRSA